MMKKEMKYAAVAGCLFSLLFLTACGGGMPGGSQAPASSQPEETAVPVEETLAPTAETAAPVMTEPSTPTDNTVTQVVETVPEEAGTAVGMPGVSDQEQQSASGPFTGVLGTEFVVPEGFVQLYESPNIGYQYTFWHPEHEVRIVVYEIAPGSVPEGAYETDRSIATRNPDVTYFNEGENWFVQSGYNNNGAEIFYSKEALTDRGLKTLWITYPTAGREFGDTITADFEKNCRF
ncbi:MAG: hypothetical protein K6C12_00605 [Oscillospiraceae bacterium]|nr:hypothetical protein [Oscillospiraceae bacterium]